jgi:tetratricopeptide (TPR) repeat protein
VDLFNWGISYYKARNYMGANTVFALYANKYPYNKFGHYWCARTAAAIDSSMEKGLAVPHYLKVVELTENDTSNNLNKRYLIEAYGYIAAYKANAEKDYESSIDYFNKLLELDPNNADATRYVEILKKNRSVAGPSAEKN